MNSVKLCEVKTAIMLLVYVERGNKESGMIDSVTQTAALCQSQTKEKSTCAH